MTIQIPTKQFLKGKEFYADRTDIALRTLQKQGFEAVFMPQLIDSRIEAPRDSEIWQNWYCTPSIRATGRTKQGNPVVVYAHRPNYFSNPDNITTAIERGLVNHAGIMPQEEFQRLLDLDGSTDEQGNRLVWTVDYRTLRNPSSGLFPVKRAIKHPQTIPFLGGEERAQRYLEVFRVVHGNWIVILHSDDLHNEPLGRLLFVGGYYDYARYINCNLNDEAHFVGVHKAEGDAPKIVPTQAQLTSILAEYVAPVIRDELEQRIAKLYE